MPGCKLFYIKPFPYEHLLYNLAFGTMCLIVLMFSRLTGTHVMYFRTSIAMFVLSSRLQLVGPFTLLPFLSFLPTDGWSIGEPLLVGHGLALAHHLGIKILKQKTFVFGGFLIFNGIYNTYHIRASQRLKSRRAP